MAGGSLESIPPRELEWVLARVLTPQRGPAGRAQLRGFLDYIATARLEWVAYRRSDSMASPMLVLLLPGRTAICMLPPADGNSGSGLPGMLRDVMAQLAARELYYAQAMLEPDAAAARSSLQEAGFRFLTRLNYLERDARFPWMEPQPAAAVEWLSYSESMHGRFATTLLSTYEATLDCPELSGVRAIDDVMASHKATGLFEAELWEIAQVDGQDAGCALLSRLPQGATFEVVYMGVAPRFRGRGLGRELLARALQQCRARGARCLTLVVDERNSPARRLYEQCGFAAVGARDVFLHRWR